MTKAHAEANWALQHNPMTNYSREAPYWRSWRTHAANGGTDFGSREGYIRAVKEGIALAARVRKAHSYWSHYLPG